MYTSGMTRSDTPVYSTEQGQKSAKAEGFSIPVDWSITIDDEGHATVDDAPGRVVAGTDEKHGSEGGQSSRMPNAPADGEGKQNGGKGDLLFHIPKIKTASCADITPSCVGSRITEIL